MYRMAISANEMTSLQKMTEAREDVSGYLMCTPLHNMDVVVGTVITGRGNSGLFRHDPSEAKKLEEMMIYFPELNVVEMHVHSRGTVERFGQEYATGLSPEDRKAILENDDGHRHMLITPSAKKVYGVKDREIVELPDPMFFDENDPNNHAIEEFHMAFNEIAASYGIGFHREKSE